jgi:hypothetical protein
MKAERPSCVLVLLSAGGVAFTLEGDSAEIESADAIVISSSAV